MNLVNIVSLLIVILSCMGGLKAAEPGAMDCKCDNVAPGNFCSGSMKLKGTLANGAGCRAGYLYHCDKDGGANGQYAMLTKCYNGCAKTDKIGEAYCQKKPPCVCNNQEEGSFCGGSKRLRSTGTGCNKNRIYKCGFQKEGTKPTGSKNCPKGCELRNNEISDICHQ